MYGEAFLHVVSDGQHKLVNTNFPPGHTHRSWTVSQAPYRSILAKVSLAKLYLQVEEVRSDLLNNVNIGAQLDGDWS